MLGSFTISETTSAEINDLMQKYDDEEDPESKEALGKAIIVGEAKRISSVIINTPVMGYKWGCRDRKMSIDPGDRLSNNQGQWSGSMHCNACYSDQGQRMQGPLYSSI